jgi:subtilase family serine protease
MRLTARNRFARTISAAAVAGLVAGAIVAAQPATATTWSATATKALKVVNATHLGAARPGRELRLTVGLAPRNRAGLDTLIRRQNTRGSGVYHHYLRRGEFTNRFGASRANANAVAAYLRSAGMRRVGISGNRLQVGAVATVAQAERAFNTHIASYRQRGRTVLANTAAAMVPSALAGKVTGVLGLSSLGVNAGTPSVPKLTGYFPKEFVKVYNGGNTSAGAGTTMAVFAEGKLTQTIKDLRLAESKQNLPQTPVSLVNAGPQSSDTSGADEWDLDTQTSTGVAPRASRLYIYVATSLSDSDLSKAINKWVTQDVARSGSASLGECDVLPYLDGAMKVDDTALAQAAAQGQTFFASTGDTGSSCAVAGTNGVPLSGPPDTEYPASSPYAVAVGGTTLDTDNNDNYQAEIAWNAGGGGISPVETAPKWQSGAVPTSAAGLRGVPDIALDADPNTGAQIYVSGTATQIGGTSLSSPMALGFWTRLQASHGNKLGFAAPRLYKLYQGPTGTTPGFHDVMIGANGTYVATPGWDYTTGLGSFDLNALSKALG